MMVSHVARAVIFVVYIVRRNVMNTEQMRTPPTTNVNDDEKENPDEMETTNIRSENCQQQAAAVATAIPLASSAAGADVVIASSGLAKVRTGVVLDCAGEVIATRSADVLQLLVPSNGQKGDAYRHECPLQTVSE
jgi:hypothetical protein